MSVLRPGTGTDAVQLAATAPDDRIRRLLDTIASEAPRRIAELALELNLSESHLQHLFKRQLGVGLGHLLMEHRLQKAAVLLTRTRLRIKEIAASVGYEHTSSFTRAFTRRFAQTPQAYRRRAGRDASIEGMSDRTDVT